MKIITSKHNEAIKKIVSLHTPKGRHEHQEFIAEGIRTIERFAHAGHAPLELYMTEKAYGCTNLYPNIHPILVSDEVMGKISTLSTAPGVLAVFSTNILIKNLTDLTHKTRGIVLADLQDPGNIGTLIRSAAAFNYDSAIIIEGADVLSPKVIQASAGTIASLKIIKCSWNELQIYQQRPPLCALVVEGGVIDASVIKTQEPLVIIGNEAHGLPYAWSQVCESKFTIPMNKAAESLNAAIAGSIALFLLQN